MIRIDRIADINWGNLYRVAYQHEAVSLGESLLAEVDRGCASFAALIADGVACYGVTTGLGRLVESELDTAARAELPANMLRARAAAIGPPFAKPVARAMLLLRLVNFLGGRAGVRAELCRYLVARLNDDFTPWVPSLGHGMAADAIANTHAFQTLIGEGWVYGPDLERQSASAALRARAAEPFELVAREGLALVNGVCAAPALAMFYFYRIENALALANLVAAVSMEGLAAPRDAIDPAVSAVSLEPGIARTVEILRKHLHHSQVDPHKLQAPVSYRVIPQVHGALLQALAELRRNIEICLGSYSDNPLMDGGRLLSVGCFHNQHLVNQVEQVALALAHIGCLSERRLHRLLDAASTGLQPQLAARPGLDAGLVVTQKACLDFAARLRLLAQPVSLLTGESSGGQEDYMSMAIPALMRLDDMLSLLDALLANELLAGLTALRQRGQTPGDDVAAVAEYFATLIPAQTCDRAPAGDVETILEHFHRETFAALYR